MRFVKAAQAETKLPHAQLGQLCILTGHLTLLGNRCQSTIIKRKQMGEVKMYLLISLTHGQAVRKTGTFQGQLIKCYFPSCLFLQSDTREAGHPYLICIWHQPLFRLINTLDLSPLFCSLHLCFSQLLPCHSLDPLDLLFLTPPPEAFTQICNRNLKFRRHPNFLSLTERKLSNQLIVISTFCSKHRLI